MKTVMKALPAAVALAFAGAAGGVAASGFALTEQNASGLGNAYAGQAAVAEDASTIFFNPAGMSRLAGKQVVFSLSAIDPSAQFSNTGSRVPAIPGAPPLGGTPYALGPNGRDAGGWAYLPTGYFSMALTPNWSVGVGINAPFGLKTEYDANWVGRFYAIKSELTTYNINPSVSYKVNDAVSIGAGINYQHARAELTNGVNYSAAAASAIGGGGPLAVFGPIATAPTEGVAKLTGSDNAWGFNLGAMFNVSPDTRLGVAYRSSISYKISGNVSLSNRPVPLTGLIPDAPATADLKMPASFSASVFSKLNSRWDVMADLSWTQWSSFQTLTVVTPAGVLSSTPENWRDTWRAGVGLTYHYNDAWTSRIGVAYDQTPVPDATRTPRIPDNDRTWLAIGGQFKISPASAVDFGYAHLWVKNGSVNLPASGYAATSAVSSGTLVGNYSNKVDILSVQYRHSF